MQTILGSIAEMMMIILSRHVMQFTLVLYHIVSSSSLQQLFGHNTFTSSIHALNKVDGRFPPSLIPLVQNCNRPCAPIFRTHRLSKSTLNGVLSRSAIMKNAATSSISRGGNAEKKKKEQQEYLSKSFLSDAIDEAVHRQIRAVEALELAIISNRNAHDGTTDILKEHVETSTDDSNWDSSTLDRMISRQRDVNQSIDSLNDLKLEVNELKPTLSDLVSSRDKFHELGFGSILKQPMESWKTKREKDVEFGRPLGFDGLLFYSPLGVPILVGRMNAHKDDVMRNAAQGADLWFQVEDYNGSRVLLRSSQVRGTKGSKQCRQMAADLAASYSTWGDEFDTVPVMYTDSRKVAKRGSKVGNMKQNKSLGTMYGRPEDVADIRKALESSSNED